MQIDMRTGMILALAEKLRLTGFALFKELHSIYQSRSKLFKDKRRTHFCCHYSQKKQMRQKVSSEYSPHIQFMSRSQMIHMLSQSFDPTAEPVEILRHTLMSRRPYASRVF